MQKRYIMIFIVLVTLIMCFIFFFNKPSNLQIYDRYYQMISKNSEYNNLEDNNDVVVDYSYKLVNEKYSYVISIKANKEIKNFKAFLVSEPNVLSYYPSFGIIDNLNVSLKPNDIKGVNLVVTSQTKLNKMKLYIAYDESEYNYLLDVN